MGPAQPGACPLSSPDARLPSRCACRLRLSTSPEVAAPGPHRRPRPRPPTQPELWQEFVPRAGGQALPLCREQPGPLCRRGLAKRPAQGREAGSKLAPDSAARGWAAAGVQEGSVVWGSFLRCDLSPLAPPHRQGQVGLSLGAAFLLATGPGGVSPVSLGRSFLPHWLPAPATRREVAGHTSGLYGRMWRVRESISIRNSGGLSRSRRAGRGRATASSARHRPRPPDPPHAEGTPQAGSLGAAAHTRLQYLHLGVRLWLSRGRGQGAPGQRGCSGLSLLKRRGQQSWPWGGFPGGTSTPNLLPV